MKIYDISQEVFSCDIYPGDDAPVKTELLRMDKGAVYNLTSFTMCAHNGTHIDAPFHFIKEGKTVESITLEKTVGVCYVACANGIMTANDARDIYTNAKNANPEAALRILLKGDAVVSEEAAVVFAEEGVCLLGTETLSVGPVDAPMAVHKILLSAEVVLLEGIRLSEVEEGCYFLSAAPLCLMGSDGAPCRALLIEF